MEEIPVRFVDMEMLKIIVKKKKTKESCIAFEFRPSLFRAHMFFFFLSTIRVLVVVYFKNMLARQGG